MYVIVTYDVGVKRDKKMLKLCRRYLQHVQKSVFEGYVNYAQLQSMKKQIRDIINFELDQVAIYKCGGKIEKEVIGYHIADENIL